MSVPRTIRGVEVTDHRPIAGGDINDAYELALGDGSHVFLKTRAGAAPGEYATEAAGLEWLADGGALVPEVFEATDEYLALAWLPREEADQEELGRRIATMHRAGAERPGARPDSRPLRIGPLTFERGQGEDWATYYGQRLLMPLAEKTGLASLVDAVAGRLPDLIEDEPPARLHGDLWSGNVFGPYLIDPAAYGGNREVDLAMLQLFGSPSERLLAAYDEVWPRAAGHEARVALYQLFPLLIHAVLFGGSYVASAERVARRYG